MHAEIFHFNLSYWCLLFIILRYYVACFLLISHTMTFTWNRSFISNRKKATWLIICLKNKWIFFKPRQSSGSALKSHLKYLNELNKFDYRLGFIAAPVTFLAASVRICILFSTAGHSALMIAESIDRIDVVLSSETDEIQSDTLSVYCCIILSSYQHVLYLPYTHMQTHALSTCSDQE